MAKCDYCGSTILFGGRQSGALRFCNDRCSQGGALIEVAQQLPEHIVQQEVWAVHQGLCPKCKGSGPVDVHVSHRVWSAILLTSWSSQPAICCRACGVKSQLGNAVLSLLVGWWGIPWGLVMTPVQIVRNFVGMARGHGAAAPSKDLERAVRLELGARALAHRGG